MKKICVSVFLFLLLLSVFSTINAKPFEENVSGRVMLLDDGGLAISYDFSALPVPENKIISIITPNINYGPKDVYVKINNNKVDKEKISFKNSEKHGLPEGISVSLDGLDLQPGEPIQLSAMISASTFLEKGFESCNWGYKSDLDYDP